MANLRLAATVLLVLGAASGWLLLDPTGAFMGDGLPSADNAPMTRRVALLDPRQGTAVIDRKHEARVPANPLSSIAIGSLDEIVERPLFNPTRHATPAALEPVIEAPPAAVAETFGPDDVTLLGVVAAGADKTALLRLNKTSELLRLKSGQSFAGWRLDAIGDRSVVIKRGGRAYPLDLFAGKPAAVPAATD